MKTFSLMTAMTVLSIILFSSCEKSDAENPVIPAVLDSNYLDKEYMLFNSDTDTSGIRVFNYDAQKRLVSMVDSDYPPQSSVSTIFSYHGNDSLPFKSSRVYVSANPVILEHYYYYDQQGRVDHDSTYQKISSPLSITITTRRFSYAPQRIYVNSTLDAQSTSSGGTYKYDFYDTATLDNKGNIIKSKRTREAFGGGMIITSQGVYTYDDKPNPWAKLNIFGSQLTLPEYDTDAYYLKFLGVNNLLTQHEDNMYFQIDRTYNWNYNHAGFPSMWSGVFEGYTDKSLFVYKSL